MNVSTLDILNGRSTPEEVEEHHKSEAYYQMGRYNPNIRKTDKRAAIQIIMPKDTRTQEERLHDLFAEYGGYEHLRQK